MPVSPDTHNLRIVFAGSPAFAAAHLAALIQAGFNIVSAYSQPDRPSGRGKKLQPGPVKQLAQYHNIPVFQPDNFGNEHTLDVLRQQKADLIVVVAYGLLLPDTVLAIPQYGCLNVHASLLPRWRGAAPVERAVMAGDQETGVCIMQMEQGLDTGPVLKCASTPIFAEDTGETLGARLQDMGCDLLVATLEDLVKGKLMATPQNDELATYASKITRRDARIDWENAATAIHHQIRALFPRYPAFSEYRGSRLRILDSITIASTHTFTPGTLLEIDKSGLLVACGEHTLIRIKSIQLEGKKPMSIASLLNGHPHFFTPGTSFGNPVDHA